MKPSRLLKRWFVLSSVAVIAATTAVPPPEARGGSSGGGRVESGFHDFPSGEYEPSDWKTAKNQTDSMRLGMVPRPSRGGKSLTYFSGYQWTAAGVQHDVYLNYVTPQRNIPNGR